jgi:hypothetical protein
MDIHCWHQGMQEASLKLRDVWCYDALVTPECKGV